MSAQLERLELFDYLLVQCEHKEEQAGDTHWHVCHLGNGVQICVTANKMNALVIGYGLALYDRISVSEQMQILGESQQPAELIDRITFDEFMAWLNPIQGQRSPGNE